MLCSFVFVGSVVDALPHYLSAHSHWSMRHCLLNAPEQAKDVATQTSSKTSLQLVRWSVHWLATR